MNKMNIMQMPLLRVGQNKLFFSDFLHLDFLATNCKSVKSCEFVTDPPIACIWMSYIDVESRISRVLFNHDKAIKNRHCLCVFFFFLFLFSLNYSNQKLVQHVTSRRRIKQIPCGYTCRKRWHELA